MIQEFKSNNDETYIGPSEIINEFDDSFDNNEEITYVGRSEPTYSRRYNDYYHDPFYYENYENYPYRDRSTHTTVIYPNNRHGNTVIVERNNNSYLNCADPNVNCLYPNSFNWIILPGPLHNARQSDPHHLQ